MADAGVSTFQRKLVLTLMWINTGMPTLRTIVICVETFFGMPLDVPDAIFHALITPLNYIVAWMHMRGYLSLRSMGAVYVEIDSFVFIFLGFFVDRHLMLVWLMGSIYSTFFIEAQLIDNSSIKVLVFLRPLVFTMTAGVLTGDIEFLHSKDLFALFSIFSFGMYGIHWYTTQESDKLALYDMIKEVKLQLTTVLEALPLGVFVIADDGQIATENYWSNGILNCMDPNDLLKELSNITYIEGRRLYGGNSSNELLLEDIKHFHKVSKELIATFGMTGAGQCTFSWQGKRVVWGCKPAVVIVIKDVTNIIDHERAELESKYKSVMLRSVSHELRSPISGISHAIRTVCEFPEMSLMAKQKLELAEVCCNHVLMLVNDLLDYSQIIAGKFNLTYSYFDLRKTLVNSFELMRLIADKKKLTFIMHIDPLLPELAFSDPNRLSQVIMNLLSNAVKFTPKNGRVELQAKLDDGGQMEITVKDSGIGISPEHLKSLFKVFGRLENSALINPQGIGLGLHISKMLAKELGSCGIKVESIVDKGSCFSFNVKIFEHFSMLAEFCKSSSLLDTDEYLTEPINPVYMFLVKTQECPEVLIVDDNLFSRSVVADILGSEDITHYELGSGREALDYVHQKAKNGLVVKAIIMDIELPELDGPSAAIAINNLLISMHLPLPKIIGHSGDIDLAAEQRCKDAGMVAFLPKPSTKDAIITTVRHFLY